MRRQCENGGFTLIEVLVVLSLLALIQAWVVPALSETVDAVRVSSSAQAMSGSLMLARSEAVKRNVRVIVCKSVTGERCDAAAAWEQGWIVFHDFNNNGLLDTDESVLHREQALPPSIRLRGNSPVGKYVSYTPYGRTKLTSGAFQAGTFTVCTHSPRRVQARQIVINNAGRVRVAVATLAECI